jgi:4-amino-4-deoxy-L-arabinose transferase-like glycosyltransferase
MVALVLCIPGLSQGALATDTAWYTAIAAQAWQDAGAGDLGALWTLRGIDDQPYFNKPPLAFWVNGIPVGLFGPNVAAARIGSICACVLCVLAIARLGRLLAGPSIGFAAGLVLALTWEFIRHSHAFSLDLWMSLFLTLAACSVAGAHRKDIPPRVLLAGIWIGLALMVKPLVPLLALPLLGVWLCAVGRGRWLAWLLLAAGVAIAVAAPWHLSMWSIHGEAFSSQYFGREIIDRAAAGPVADVNKGSASPAYYLVVLLRAYWPWLVTFAIAALAFIRREGTSQAREALAMALFWSLGWLLLLSIFPDKRPRYLLVAYPMAALASGVLLTHLAPISVRQAWKFIGKWTLPTAILVSVAITAAPVRLHRDEPPQWAELFTWLNSKSAEQLYAGGFAPQRSAQIYLAVGRWPIPTRSAAGDRLNDPPAEALILYHRRDGLAPGVGESVQFTRGELTVTRLDTAPWSPILAPDKGE